MSSSHYARIAVNVPQVSGLFDYSIPPDLPERIKPGSLVTVPFGRQTVQGIVVELPQTASVPNPKEILSLVEDEPVVSVHQIALAFSMAEENLSSLAACLDLMLPPGLAKQADTLLHLADPNPSAELTPLQTRILKLLHDLRGKQLDRSLPNTDWRKSLPGLLKKGVVTSRPILQEPTIKSKTARAVRFLHMPGTPE